MRRLKIIATYLNLFIEKYSTCLLDRAGQFGHINIEVKRVRALLFKTIYVHSKYHWSIIKRVDSSQHIPANNI